MIFKMLQRVILALCILMAVFQLSFAAAEILDVQIEEFATEITSYNPLQSSSGMYAGAGENMSLYEITGQINISNVHGTQAAQDILVNITGVSTIFDVVHESGSQGFVTQFNPAENYMILFIPDLGVGNSSVFTYTVNTTLVAPPINLTASYSSSRIFSGLPITITDTVENVMNTGLYADTCVSNITVDIFAMTIDNVADLLNVTLSDLAGSDSSNAVLSGDGRTISWSVLDGACLNSGDSTDIIYDALTPEGIAESGSYEIVNSTMRFEFANLLSRINVESIVALIDLEIEFEKYLNSTISDDEGVWRISSSVFNPSNIDVNLTQVSHWVSVRDSTGTGFTNPGDFDTDLSGNLLTFNYTPNMLLNLTTGNWNSTGDEWFFNYTIDASPIVWMDITSFIIDDGLQLQDRSVSFGDDLIYIRELYIATGYWLQISRNITRLADNEFNVNVTVVNLGTSPTPANQAVLAFNFIPNTFDVTSPFVFSESSFYTTDVAQEDIDDFGYNGTMYQFAILGNNPQNVSLAAFNGASNQNNTWSVTYNVTGDGEFNFDDLFLTGVDPLNVGEVGATNFIAMQGVLGYISARTEYVLATAAVVLGFLVIFM